MVNWLFISNFLIGIAVLFIFYGIVALLRVFKGKTMQDRVIAVNFIGTKTVIVIALFSASLRECLFLEVALVYAMLNFLMTIAISKFVVERREIF